MTKQHRLGALRAVGVYFAQFWRLGSPRSGRRQTDVWWEPVLIDDPLLAVASHGRRSFLVSFLNNSTNSIHEVFTLMNYSLPKGPTSKSLLTLGIRFPQEFDAGGWTQTFPLWHCKITQGNVLVYAKPRH